MNRRSDFAMAVTWMPVKTASYIPAREGVLWNQQLQPLRKSR